MASDVHSQEEVCPLVPLENVADGFLEGHIYDVDTWMLARHKTPNKIRPMLVILCTDRETQTQSLVSAYGSMIEHLHFIKAEGVLRVTDPPAKQASA
jgi:hypothetical protein